MHAALARTGIEGAQILWRGDGDCHAAVPEGFEQIAACLAGQFPVVLVNMGEVVTRAGNGNAGRGGHEYSILAEYGNRLRA